MFILSFVIPTAVKRASARTSARAGVPNRAGFARLGVGVGWRDLVFVLPNSFGDSSQ
jgi:hypothetical protein